MALINIWGDESSQNAHRYMVLGTIWQHPSCAIDLERDVQSMRREVGFKKEFHWTELKGHHLTAYKELVRIFKKYSNQGLLKYRAIVVDQTDRAHKVYSDDDELHFYKMYFWLIYKRILTSNQYDIFLDRKTNSVPGRLSDLKNSLNSKVFNENWINQGKIVTSVVRRVEPRDGSQIELQMADVFTGAVAYVRNGFYSRVEPDSKNPKFHLVNHIQDVMDTGLRECHWPNVNEHFNIWCFRR